MTRLLRGMSSETLPSVCKSSECCSEKVTDKLMKYGGAVYIYIYNTKLENGKCIVMKKYHHKEV